MEPGALLLEPCPLCEAPAGVRCGDECPGDARSRTWSEDEAEHARCYPRPVRPYSPALDALHRAR